jgi:hypothetical protein
VRIIVLALFPLGLAVAFTLFPFALIHLGTLETIDPLYIYLGTPAVLVIVLAATAVEVTTAPLATVSRADWRPSIFASFLLALTLSSFLAYKYLHFLEFIGGSSRDLYRIRNVDELAAVADRRFRVLAGPNSRSSEYFSDNVLLAYGLPTFGGYFNLVDAWHNAYWAHAGVATKRGYSGLTQAFDRCNEVFHLDNLDLLRLAGVRYIVGRTPIEAVGLTLLSAPSQAQSSRCEAPGLSRILLSFREAGTIRDAFIYELGGALPLVYFAREARHNGAGLDTDAFWDDVRRLGPERIVSGPFIDRDRRYSDDAQLVSVAQQENGYLIDTTSPSEALIILGHPKVPFWSASVDGRPADVLPVNGIDMAVELSAGRHRIAFTYRRPMPSDIFLDPLLGVLR